MASRSTVGRECVVHSSEERFKWMDQRVQKHGFVGCLSFVFCVAFCSLQHCLHPGQEMVASCCGTSASATKVN